MLPGFLCVGAAKAGSTTINDVLSQHQNIFLPPAKELHFFDNDEFYAKGADWYASHFKLASAGQVTGEVTPAYMSYESVPERIRMTLGDDVKIIFSLREPVARAYSEFLHNRRRGFIAAEFDEAIRWEFERTGLTRWERRKFSFISRGYYAQQISRFLEIFPRSNMFFIIMEEDFGSRSPETFAALLDFLGVEQRQLDFEKRSNVAYEPRSMAAQRMLFIENPVRRWARSLVRSEQVRQYLRRRLMWINARRSPPPVLTAEDRERLQGRFFATEIAELEKILGRDLSVWLNNSEAGVGEYARHTHHWRTKGWNYQPLSLYEPASRNRVFSS